MRLESRLNVLLLVLLCMPPLARAQGTAFSYQGHLVENGVAANGGHDFIFSLFNAAAGGGQIGPAMPLNNIPVASGQFNVTLDFGASVFTGAPRWLEISVRPAGVGQFTKMDSRVSLLPTPYAIFATTAASVADGAVTANADGLLGILRSLCLHDYRVLTPLGKTLPTDEIKNRESSFYVRCAPASSSRPKNKHTNHMSLFARFRRMAGWTPINDAA